MINKKKGVEFMARFCPNCGNEVAENSNFCTKCGTNLGNSDNTKNGSTVIINNYNTTNNSGIKIPERNIVTNVIFTILTCGIYGIYWFICLTDDANIVSEENDTSGGMAFVLSLITCNIYGIYWAYRMGQKIHEAGQKRNIAVGDNSVLYLILQFLGLGIINYCLMQSDLNKFAK